jgi:hypothetical protein
MTDSYDHSNFLARTWQQLSARTRGLIWICLLSGLAILAAYNTVRGVIGLILDSHDLIERYDEWKLFREGIYPAFSLANEQARSLPYFRTTVYLPWALPMFGVFFLPWGLWQGKIILLVGNILCLILFALIGWFSLRPVCRNAGLLGSLTPLAIMGNMPAFQMGQFSILCMGAVSIQWFLLARRSKYLPGLAWALGMLKPQIAFFYVLPLLSLASLASLAMGSCLLLLLSALALFHTGTSPIAVAGQWLNTLDYFASAHNLNLIATLLQLVQGPHLFFLLGLVVFVLGLSAWAGCMLMRKLDLPYRPDLMTMAGFCSILGYISFYHVHYDKIMLYPALLACFSLAMKKPALWSMLLSILLAATVWLPHRLLDAVPGSRFIQLTIWLLVGFVFAVNLLRRQPSLRARYF